MPTLANASKICYGTLSLSPLQSQLNLTEKVSLLRYAFEKGINFFDTAELYETYDILGQLIREVGREPLLISTKSYAYSKETAEESVNQALREMGTDYIDVFMLHEQESIHTFRGHYTALERLLKYKSDGIIKKVGISTHFHTCVQEVGVYDALDIIHPIFNQFGMGIPDGTIQDMEKALSIVKSKGKQVLAMKPFAGGHLTQDPIHALNFVLQSPLVDWIAIGMRYREEIDFNWAVYKNQPLPKEWQQAIKNKHRQLNIAWWCTGCGACVSRCQQKALSLVDKKAVVDPEKCVLCSYCATACQDFCIKII